MGYFLYYITILSLQHVLQHGQKQRGEDAGCNAGESNGYAADGKLHGADVSAGAGADAVTGSADGKTNSQIAFNSCQMQHLVVKGCADHAGKDNGCGSQCRYAADSVGYLYGDRGSDGFRQQREEYLFAGAKHFAADIYGTNCRYRCHADAA